MSLEHRYTRQPIKGEMSPGLLRQRRNLLLSSATIVVLNLGDFTFTRLNLLGFVAEIGDPKAVKDSIGLIWAYTLLRYWQYFKDAEMAFSRHWEQILMYNTRDVTGYELRSKAAHLPDIREKLVYAGGLSWQLKPISSEYEERPSWDNHINLLQMSLICLFSFVEFSLESTAATDYLLPFLVAIMAAGYVFFF